MKTERRHRAWVWTGPKEYSAVAVVVELAENAYLRIHRDGRHSTYESPVTPLEGAYSYYWEEA